MPRHLLVTNDFPPNVGGIQNYLWEIWNRLPPESFSVLTHHHEAAKDFDRQTQFRIVRSSSHVLFPNPKLLGEIRQEVKHSGSELVLLDPIWLPGMLGPRLEVPYGLVIHGSEATLPAAMPGVRHLLRRILSAAEIVVTASLWAIQEVRNSCFYAPEVVYVPPSVDTTRFLPTRGGATFSGAPPAGDRPGGLTRTLREPLNTSQRHGCAY